MKTKMCMRYLPVAVFFLSATVAFPAQAQEEHESPTLYEQATRDHATRMQHRHDRDDLITVVVENDNLGGGTDQYYTSGVRLGYMNLNAEFPEFAHDIASFIPTFDINETSSVFYSLGQNLYTPRNIENRTQNPDDRPWAAFLYGSIGMISMTDNHTDEVELTLGMVGPAALGEQTQKFIHRHISNSPKPNGWSNQLKNEPAVMIAWQRAWPKFLSADFGPLHASVRPHHGITLGNVYTHANAGINIQIGPAAEKWQDTPMRVRPALPGTGYFDIPENKWSWYAFAGVEGRAIARNIFLDGNSFSDSHSVDKKYFVGDANAGLSFTYDKVRISYTLVYRTEEFQTQEKPHVFGALSIGSRF
jgi:lipid A 3-O-deacylase